MTTLATTLAITLVTTLATTLVTTLAITLATTLATTLAITLVAIGLIPGDAITYADRILTKATTPLLITLTSI